MEWISVKDKLPTKECIAVGHQNEMIIGYIGKDPGYDGYTCEGEGEILTNITHWMQLPELPKH